MILFYKQNDVHKHHFGYDVYKIHHSQNSHCFQYRNTSAHSMRFELFLKSQIIVEDWSFDAEMGAILQFFHVLFDSKLLQFSFLCSSLSLTSKKTASYQAGNLRSGH